MWCLLYVCALQLIYKTIVMSRVKEAFFPHIPALKEEAAEDVGLCVVSGIELGRPA